jgi:hypothetical protein
MKPLNRKGETMIIVQQVMNQLRARFQSLWSRRSNEIETPENVNTMEEAYRKGYLQGYWTGIGDGVEASVVEGLVEVDRKDNLCV